MESSNAPKVGAPTKYRDDIPKKLTEFFDRPLYTVDSEGNRIPSKLPTIERFCCEIDITKDTFYRWIKEDDKKALSDAFSKAKSYQKDQLMQMALMGIYKEGFAKFVAINVTDMVDKKEVETNNNIKINEVNLDSDDAQL